MLKYLIFLLLCLSTLAAAATADSERLWIERNGLVAIECEGAGPNGWAVETKIPGFLGSGYFHHTGSASEVIYRILIITPGT